MENANVHLNVVLICCLLVCGREQLLWKHGFGMAKKDRRSSRSNVHRSSDVRRGLSRVISSYQSDRLKSIVDTYVGICIIALYFTYFLVVKGMLSVFSCIQKNGGPFILTEDPSVQASFVLWILSAACAVFHFGFPCSLLLCLASQCYVEGGVQQRLVPWAYLSMALYAIGTSNLTVRKDDTGPIV